MKLLLTSDTHLPVRARDLPEPLWNAVDAADVVVHAGDWVSVALLDALEARADRLVAVHGNNDGAALRARLPEVARVELDGVRLAVVHETGPAAGRERRCAMAYPDVDVLVFGHSHIPWDTLATRADGGTLHLLNPGSPTDRRRQPTHTWMTADINHGRLAAVTLHHLPPRREGVVSPGTNPLPAEGRRADQPPGPPRRRRPSPRPAGAPPTDPAAP